MSLESFEETATTFFINMPRLAHISLLVADCEEVVAFYTRLGFQVVEDTPIPAQDKR